VQISLDDFGTGYSTLAWLQRLPVDQVKIDRSFVEGLPGDSASMAVVRGVLALARELGLDVVAEGVETQEQLEALRSAGCRWVQGYLLGRPSPERPALSLQVAAPALVAA
jgi:EAL domain-containing protein (putative c-di-GMP-specific phosphodiesterase class I)